MEQEVGMVLALVATYTVTRHVHATVVVWRVLVLVAEYAYFTGVWPQVAQAVFLMALGVTVGLWTCQRKGSALEITEVVAWTWMALAIL